MLNLTGTLRTQLWRSSNWADIVQRYSMSAMAGPRTIDNAREVIELAGIAEEIVSDQHLAITLYSWAWRVYANPEWIHRAIVLATNVGDYHTKAILINEQYQQTWAAPLLEDVALAHLDAGEQKEAAATLQMALEHFREHPTLPLLLKATLGIYRDFSDLIEMLKSEASELDPISKATTLLLASRLAAVSNHCDREMLLLEAFQAAPCEDEAFLLLENIYIERDDCDRLRELYQVRSERAQGTVATIEVYRKAGNRLLAHRIGPTDSQRELGIVLLVNSTRLIFGNSLELPGLIATLSLLVEGLVYQSENPVAVRILAKALAQPRCDDEVMWIVNMGLELVADDALPRTSVAFEDLRLRVLSRHPKILDDAKPHAFPMVQTGSLRIEELEEIDDEMEELTKTWGPAAAFIDFEEM